MPRFNCFKSNTPKCGYCNKKKRWWNRDWYFGMPGFCNTEHRRYFLQDELERKLVARAGRNPSE